MARFELNLLSAQAHLISPATSVPVAVDACIKMLSCVASKAAGILVDKCTICAALEF